MANDFRMDAAKYYDFDPRPPNDIEFYHSLLPSSTATVLELGCGTGRVLIPLSAHCGYILGVDRSESMLTICRQKMEVSGVSPRRASAQMGDITDLNLGRNFDLIIAPFRVFQGLETDEEVTGFFRTIRSHFSPEGTCILCVFKPREGMATEWASEEESLEWETAVEGGRVTCFSRPIRIDIERQVIYPDLIYRRYRGDTIADEAVLKLAMRYYYPEQFEDVVESHGFRIMGRWGGYAGERYGEGPELVLQFCDH